MENRTGANSAAEGEIAPKERPNIVVLGTGFAAFSFLDKIDATVYRIHVISPRNHFLFTPLLPSTSVGTIEFRSIIEPIRAAYPKAEYYDAQCTAIDPQRKSVTCRGAFGGGEFEIPFDILLIAVGAVNNTFGIPGVSEHALFLKELSDARKIRQRISECFERAAQPGTEIKDQKRWLHFVVVGGGPTGIEFAAEMHDFIEDDLRKFYPKLMPHVRITLLEALEQILSTFDKTLSEYTMRHFRRQKIEVLTNSMVSRIEEDSIIMKGGTRIPYGLVVWSTGVKPTDLVKNSDLPKEKSNRLIVDTFLQSKDHPGIYALGDCATLEGILLPMTAQVAEQEGAYLGKALTRRFKGKSVEPFRYQHGGMLAYIGSERALADLTKIKGKGYYTWLFWRSAYLTKLVSLKNKVLVLFDWMKTRLFGRDISRF